MICADGPDRRARTGHLPKCPVPDHRDRKAAAVYRGVLHLGKAMALWQAGIAAAVTLSPPLAALVIGAAGLTAGFAISGAALVLLSCVSLLALARRAAATGPALNGGPRCPTFSP